MYDIYFSGRRSHETERFFAANQFNLYADLVEHETILKEQLGVQTSHHVEFATCHRERRRWNSPSFLSFGAMTVASILLPTY